MGQEVWLGSTVCEGVTGAFHLQIIAQVFSRYPTVIHDMWKKWRQYNHPYCMSVMQELLQVDKEMCPHSCVISTINGATGRDPESHIVYYWSMVSPHWLQ